MDYKVEGMTCSACSARVEKVVSALEGVDSCVVNLLTGDMKVEGTVSTQSVIDAVTGAGYGASLKGTKSDKKVEINETKPILKRFLVSLAFLLPLMYVTMGHVMWGAPLPDFFAKNPLATALLEMVLAGIVLVINQRFFINGAKGLIKRAPNMDTLVSLGSASGFIYSLVRLFGMTELYATADTVGAYAVLHDLYFEASAMILVLISLGKMLEAMSKGRTTDALKSLMSLSPDTAVVIRDGKEVTVLLSELRVDEIFVVRAGDRIPVDGEVVEGSGSIDESALTGESIPVDKLVGSKVYQGTVLSSGYIRCISRKVGEDTTLSKIIKSVTDVSSTKAPIARLADKVSGVFVPVVIGIAIITLAIWLIAGESIGYSLARAISVLVISCPCALGLATPVAIMVASGKGARQGVLFKTAESIESLGKVSVVALDKTGTVTEGVPTVTDVIACTDENELMSLSYSLELKSEHPLSRAIVSEGEKRKTVALDITDFVTVAGRGLQCKVGDRAVRGGNLEYVKEICSIDEDTVSMAKKLSDEGKTPLFFAQNDRFLGIIAVSDTVKEDSTQAIKDLKAMGISVVMLTGDNERTARAIAERVGVDEVYASVLPDKKGKIIDTISKSNKVAMIGDGINDALALTTADVGVAIGAGADVAIDSADVVLSSSRLSDAVKAIRLSRGTLRVIKQNLFWAFIYNSLGIPLAGGAFVSLLGWSMNPMLGALFMSMSSVCVVCNALRINLFKLGKQNENVEKEDGMKKVMKIEGIMCMHCEARVKGALETIEGVGSANVSHKKGTAVVKLDMEVCDEILKDAVEKEGYKVISIE